MRKPRQRPRQRLSVLWTALLLVLCPTLAMPSATAADDVEPPRVVDFSFYAQVVDVGAGHQYVTVTAHLVDQSGAKAPVVVIGTEGSSRSRRRSGSR